MSTPGVTAALQKAPASDIVALSEAANQLQGIGELFGSSSSASSTTGTDPSSLLNSALATLEQKSGQGSSSSTTLATQLANLQTQELQSLFGSSSNTNQPSGSLINLVG